MDIQLRLTFMDFFVYDYCQLISVYKKWGNNNDLIQKGNCLYYLREKEEKEKKNCGDR